MTKPKAETRTGRHSTTLDDTGRQTAHQICTQGVRGSNPLVSTNPITTRVFALSSPPEGSSKAGAHPSTGVDAAIEAFLLNRRVAGCSGRTLEAYAANLARFRRSVAFNSAEEVTLLAVQSHLSGLREQMKPVSVHQHFRTLKTFFNWCLEAGLLNEHPMRGLNMKMPKTLPRVPEDDDARKLLQTCPDTFEGRRNRALIALLADSGLRIFTCYFDSARKLLNGLALRNFALTSDPVRWAYRRAIARVSCRSTCRTSSRSPVSLRIKVAA